MGKIKISREKVIYYKDEINDDFSNTNIDIIPLPDNYIYMHKNIFWRFFSFILYFVIAKPIIYLIVKLLYAHRFGNKNKIKEVKKCGAILYGNHTTKIADAFVPNLLLGNRRNYIISSPETMSIKGIRTLLAMLGVLPLTNKLSLKKELLRCLKTRLNQNALITIYPEAHIWPYYTKIRNFDETSFKYAALFNKPVYAITTCYQKRKIIKRPKIVTYLDGPFYPKEELNTNENAKYLRDLVYDAMNERAKKYSTYEYIKYVKINDSNH